MLHVNTSLSISSTLSSKEETVLRGEDKGKSTAIMFPLRFLFRRFFPEIKHEGSVSKQYIFSVKKERLNMATTTKLLHLM